MTYLVHADVSSEATKPDPDPDVLDWLTKNEAELATDPIVLGEIVGVVCTTPVSTAYRPQTPTT